ncbi:MAG TPA: imidazolonepropionase [Gemmatimonadales bacterium]|jgi:imidazolonepropionase|nr:imidazolonepropionase [Gemmatimonadales bacterium]
MRVLANIGQLATCRDKGGQGEIHAIPDAALVWDEAVIVWAGRASELPKEYRSTDRIDAGGRLVIPGLIDCHTHLAFGGWRAEEFEQRIRGRTYLEIAQAGGGIASTVRQTREATEQQLVERAGQFLEAMLALGVTTVECKSGYGLSEEAELKLLRVYRRLAREQPVRLVPTFLGAHVVPAEYRDRRAAYVDLLVSRLIPTIAREKLAACCDVFLEESAFSPDEARRILRAGQEAGLAAKLHADQLTSNGGAELAAELGALSADHLEHISERGVLAMAQAGVVAVSLPLASLYLGQPPLPARRLIEAGVAVAVATDFNPGTAPSYHLPLALTLACTLQRMTPQESLKGATLYAARAVGLERSLGSLEPGKAADFALIDAPDVNHWLYHFRPNACIMTTVGGINRWSAANGAHQPA